MSTIQPHHLQRQAYVYLHQSTPSQVDTHRESTEDVSKLWICYPLVRTINAREGSDDHSSAALPVLQRD